MRSELVRVSGQGASLLVPRRTSLTDAFGWVEPGLREPLRLEDSRRDWWEPLKIELLQLAAAWLDLRHFQHAGTLDSSFQVRTWRPAFWTATQSGASERPYISTPWVPVMIGAGLLSRSRGDVFKRFGIDGDVRRWASALMPRGDIQSRSGVTFLCEVPSPSMAGSILAVSRENDLIVAADPRVLAAARRTRTPAVSLWAGTSSSRGRPNVTGLSRLLQERLEVVDGGFAEVISRPLARLLSGLVRDYPRVETLLQKSGTRTVVIASDQHRYGVLACWAANVTGAKSLVLQHGLPIDRVGYTPPRADHFAVFGDTSREFFADAGVRRDRLHLVGLPRPSRRSWQRDGSLLVPLQPLASAAQQSLIRLAVEYARHPASKHPVTLRVHPGDPAARAERDVDLLRRYAWPQDLPVCLDRGSDPAEALGSAIAVLTHESTFGLDAIAAGVPVVLSAIGRDSPLRGEDVCEVATAAELIDFMASLGDAHDHHQARTVIQFYGADSVRQVRRLLDSLGNQGEQSCGW